MADFGNTPPERKGVYHRIRQVAVGVGVIVGIIAFLYLASIGKEAGKGLLEAAISGTTIGIGLWGLVSAIGYVIGESQSPSPGILPEFSSEDGEILEDQEGWQENHERSGAD